MRLALLLALPAMLLTSCRSGSVRERSLECGRFPHLSAEEAFERADAVFRGRVQGATRSEVSPGTAAVVTLVEASVVWKDDVPRQVEIITPPRQDGCGRMDLLIGEEYLFYTRHPAEPAANLKGEPRPTWTMETGACDGTRPVACAKEALAALEQRPTRWRSDREERDAPRLAGMSRACKDSSECAPGLVCEGAYLGRFVHACFIPCDSQSPDRGASQCPAPLRCSDTDSRHAFYNVCLQ